jgi:hypothetical protein
VKTFSSNTFPFYEKMCADHAVCSGLELNMVMREGNKLCKVVSKLSHPDDVTTGLDMRKS